MEMKEHNKIAAFDTLFSTNHTQMLKIILPHLDYRMQKSMAIYIKWLELNYTIDFYKKNPSSHCNYKKSDVAADPCSMCEELLPYCSAGERKQVKQIQEFMKGMEMYQEFSKTMEIMKEFMPDMTSSGPDDTTPGEDSSFSSAFNPLDLMMNMLSPEQKEMFDLLGGNSHDS